MPVAGALHSQEPAPCSNPTQAAPTASWRQVSACGPAAAGYLQDLPEQDFINLTGFLICSVMSSIAIDQFL